MGIKQEIKEPLKRIKISGFRKDRVLTCPYCKGDPVVKVTLVNHLRRVHPEVWKKWTDEFVRLYNEMNNNPKRVMREFTNAEGQLILSWSAIERYIRKKAETEDISLEFQAKAKINSWEPTEDEYRPFTTTLWNVPKRGTWAVHQSTYRGNWPPQVARALIEQYSEPGDLVLDPFVGGGTTLIEAWLLGRNAIGFDIAPMALKMTEARLAEMERRGTRESLYGLPSVDVRILEGDARQLPGIEKETIDFICTHPPYGDALSYTDAHPADLSQVQEPNRFMDEIEAAGKRWLEVLKPGGTCALLIGDLRRNGFLSPFGFETVARFHKIGFRIQDIIIKTQHQDRSTEFYYRDERLRLRLAHEYLLVFKKATTL